MNIEHLQKEKRLKVPENKIQQLASIIKTSKSTVFFGGAGVSTESGLKDFRSKDGLYYEKYKYPPEEILSHHFFIEHPEEFYKFYKEKLNSLAYKPNITHQVLSKLEKMNLLDGIITQNIDGFHQMAGSKHVVELHGSVLRNHCVKCHKFYEAKKVFNSNDIPRCECGGMIKPDVVLYEEPLNEKDIEKAIHLISNAEVLIIGGTSLNVYPAAGLIHYFKGKHLVLINKEKTPLDNICEITIYDSIGKVMQGVMDIIKRR